MTRVRTFRTERGASPTEPVDLTIDPASPDRALVPVVEGLSGVLSHLARLSGVRFEKAGSGAFADVVAGLSLGLALPRGGAADAGQRIEKSLAAADEEIAALRSKLENADFLGKAPAPVVEKVRAAALRARREAGGPRAVVIEFGGGRVDPDHWQVLENCIFFHAIPPRTRWPGT